MVNRKKIFNRIPIQSLVFLPTIKWWLSFFPSAFWSMTQTWLESVNCLVRPIVFRQENATLVRVINGCWTLNFHKADIWWFFKQDNLVDQSAEKESVMFVIFWELELAYESTTYLRASLQFFHRQDMKWNLPLRFKLRTHVRNETKFYGKLWM